jgi:hypothetical protein
MKEGNYNGLNYGGIVYNRWIMKEGFEGCGSVQSGLPL